MLIPEPGEREGEGTDDGKQSRKNRVQRQANRRVLFDNQQAGQQGAL